MSYNFGEVRGERSIGDMTFGGGFLLFCSPIVVGGAVVGIHNGVDE